MSEAKQLLKEVCLKCNVCCVDPIDTREWNPLICSACWAPIEVLINTGHAFWRSDADPKRVIESTPELAALLGGSMVNDRRALAARVSLADALGLLQSATAVLVVAGAGLSVSAGVVLPSAAIRPGEARWERYRGLDTPAVRTAHTAPPLAALSVLLGDTPSFCFTTNIDGVLPDALGAHRVAEVHGSVRRWQCAAYGSGGCSSRRLVYDGPAAGKRTRDGDTRDMICSSCRSPLRLNVSTEDDTDEDVNWAVLDEQMAQYRAFLASAPVQGGGAVVLALGVGQHTHSLVKDLPVIIEQCPGARLLVVNDADPGVCSDGLPGGSYALLEGPLEETLPQLAALLPLPGDYGATAVSSTGC
jgi:hypothetical protein